MKNFDMRLSTWRSCDNDRFGAGHICLCRGRYFDGGRRGGSGVRFAFAPHQQEQRRDRRDDRRFTFERQLHGFLHCLRFSGS